MTSRLFRVDMSEASRDYMAVATEPGLAMLDTNGANYAILRRWLGRLAAEPELINAESVSFYVREPDRGRMENVTCQPATIKDLRGPLKEELEAIDAGLRKAKPESSNERLLHKIVAKTLRDQAAELEKSDFDHYFFKYRAPGAPWRLVWCWGYQRRDQEPSRGVICTNQQCHQLFAHRQGTKRRCPHCQTVPTRKTGGLSVSLAPLLGVIALVLLAAILLALLFPSKLVVEPTHWSGPPGTEIRFEVTETKWLFFDSDVSNQIVATSSDPTVAAIEEGPLVRTRGIGRTDVKLALGGRTANMVVTVVPESITINPTRISLAVGSRAAVRGTTSSGGGSEDISKQLTWVTGDPKIAVYENGYVRGLQPGNTVLLASAGGGDSAKAPRASADISVAAVNFTALDLKLVPPTVPVGGESKLEVTGRSAEGEKYDVTGSPQLKLAVEPASLADVGNDSLAGRSAGVAKLTASLESAQGSLSFNVGGAVVPPIAGNFKVEPTHVELSVGQYATLEITAPNPAEVKAASNNEAVVTVSGGRTLSARGAGVAEVRFTYQGEERKVAVNVRPVVFTRVEVRPAVINLTVGQQQRFDVVGVTADGQSVPLAADQLLWVRQPLGSYVELSRSPYQVRGLATTPSPQTIEVRYGDSPTAVAEVTVAAAAAGTVATPEVWGVFPPVNVTRPGTVVDVGASIGSPLRLVEGQGLFIDKVPAGSVLELAGVGPGSQIRTIAGTNITGFTPAQFKEFLAKNPIGNGTIIGVAGPDGVVRDVRLGLDATVLQQVEVLPGITTTNVTPTTFDATVRIRVRERAEYRIVDESGKALSAWGTHGPAAEATITMTQVPRMAGRTEYDVNVERRLGGNVKRYPFVISLKAK